MGDPTRGKPGKSASSLVTIYVVVAVHNRWPFTEQFLASLDTQRLPSKTNVRVVVVDDGSTDGTNRRLRERTDTSVLHGDGTLWWSGSIDLALSAIRGELNSGDFVYLGNNDTVLDSDHLAALIRASHESQCDLVGSMSYEIWPTGERYPVTGAFRVNEQELEVVNVRPEEIDQFPIDALAGRGLLLSARAARAIRFQPRVMPQHFADLAATSRLIRTGYRACVSLDATSTQLERAGSSVEFKPRLSQFLNPKSQLYIPALVSFWAAASSRKAPLLWRMPIRAVRQVTQGSYRVR